MGSQTKSKQPAEFSLFTKYQVCALSGLGGVKKKSAPIGKSGRDQMKVGSWCTTKLQNFEKYS